MGGSLKTCALGILRRTRSISSGSVVPEVVVWKAEGELVVWAGAVEVVGSCLSVVDDFVRAAARFSMVVAVVVYDELKLSR